MSDLPTRPVNGENGEKSPVLRCPVCDSVVGAGDSHCLMCGESLAAPVPVAEPVAPGEAQPVPPPVPPPVPSPVEPAAATPAPLTAPSVVTSVMREQQSSATFWLTAVFTVIIIILSALVLRYQSPQVSVALVPSPTAIPPTATYTPTYTPLPTETSPPTTAPTITATPAPTDTPRPPRYHVVAGGETLIGIALRFRITPDSIAEANGFNPEQPIQVSQELLIPWPTPTPPLESALIEINNQPAVADVTDCEIYTIQPDDTAFGIAAARGIPLEAIRAVNRLTREGLELLQPGDTLCLPEIVFTDTLPPTPGPSPTPSLTPLPAGPNLIYPINWAAIEPSDEMLRLVWTAVKDLADNEWYMVEVTHLTAIDSVPHRAFTRDTALQLSPDWQPDAAGEHEFRWRVSIVQVTGERQDGRFTYTYGGQQSQPAYFTWQGRQ